MHRTVVVLAGTAALLALSHNTSAQSASASLTVSATVSKNCTISTAPVNFGAYDPVAANATAPLDGIGTLTVACTKGATAHVGLNDGSNSQGNNRRMRQSAAAYLNYQIYKDSSRTDVWGDSINNNLDLGAAPNRNPRTFTVYGRVVQGQDAAVGTYTDTIVATVNF